MVHLLPASIFPVPATAEVYRSRAPAKASVDRLQAPVGGQVTRNLTDVAHLTGLPDRTREAEQVYPPCAPSCVIASRRLEFLAGRRCTSYCDLGTAWRREDRRYVRRPPHYASHRPRIVR